MSEADSIDHAFRARSDESRTSRKLETEGSAWSVNVAGKEVVDLDHAEIVSRVRAGKLSGSTYVWREGMDEWRPLDELGEFASLSSAAEEGASPDSGTRRLDEATPPRGAFLAVYERAAPTLDFSPEAEEVEAEVLEPALPPLPPPRKPESMLAPRKPAAVAAPPRKPSAAPPRKPTSSTEPPQPSAVAAPPRPGPGPVTKPGWGEPPPAMQTPIPVIPADPVPALGSSILPPELAAADDDDGAALLDEAEVAPSPAPTLPPAIPSMEPVVAAPPKPALKTLPPIIVRELPVSPGELVASPVHARRDEATLVLGRRRTRRWVPLRAAIASSIGTACLASALTWLALKTGAEPAARVESGASKAEAPATRAPLPETPPAPELAAAAPSVPPPATTADAHKPAPDAADESKDVRPAGDARAERTERGERGAESPARAGKRDESAPGFSAAGPAAAAAGSARSGWPSNPGF